jgi:predicted dehydrogenase
MPRLFAPGGGGALLDRGVYLIALARALMGDETELVAVYGDLSPEGVDLAATVILRNGAGQRAVLSCAIDRMGDNALTLLGSHGRIQMQEPVSNPQGYHQSRIDPEAPFTGPSGLPGTKARWRGTLTGNPTLRRLAKAVLKAPQGRSGGFADQIAHVEACLAAGRTESDLVPLDNSLAVLEIIDAARARLAGH